MDTDELLNRANTRLKDGLVGAVIERRGVRLALRATLPPPPGSSQSKSFQQRLTTKLFFNPDGLRQAERLAKKLGSDLALGAFNWSEWRTPAPELIVAPPSLGEWLPRMEADYFARRGVGRRALQTWKNEYHRPLARFDMQAPLTPESIRAMILSVPADSKTRQRAANALGCLAGLMGLALPYRIATLRGTYSSLKSAPRDLPDDDTIEMWWKKIPHPGWRTIYGRIAAFGLRPSEAFRLVKIEAMPDGGAIAEVDEDTKTGARLVWALHPRWVEQFNLIDGPLPDVDPRCDTDHLGHRVAVQFGRDRYKLPFVSTSLRHAFAVRALFLGLDVGLTARIMGHSVTVHSKLYLRWIEQRHHKAAYAVLMYRNS